MKKIAALILFISFFGILAANAQNPGDRVLVEGNPPLTRGMADDLIKFFEWALEGKFTKIQRSTMSQLVIKQWQHKARSIKDTLALMMVPKMVEKMDPMEEMTARLQFKAKLVKLTKKRPPNALTILLKDVYEAGKKGDILDKKSSGPVKDGVPSPRMPEIIATNQNNANGFLSNTGGGGLRKMGDGLTGDWKGESICIDKVKYPACKDEKVVYHITATDKPDVVHISADKIVNGELENMGEFDFKCDAEKHTLYAEFSNGRVHISMEFTVTGDVISGHMHDLLSDRKVIRDITVKKQ